jgi:hypothetical protein
MCLKRLIQEALSYRIQKFQQEKAEREAKIAEELRQENLRKEREKDRIAAQATQSRELQVRTAALID